MSTILHGMSWLTLVILPVVLLLYVQFVFVPYHDVEITWIHRIALAVDVAMLILIGVFLMRAETSFFSAFWRTATGNPVSLVMTAAVLGLALFLSFFVATVPGERLDATGRRMTAPLAGADADGSARRQMAGFSLPFLRARADGSLLGFHRNLVVTDADLVADRDVSPGEASLNLRGRDLRFARLDRTDLHQADLTGADLSGASLSGTDLRGARMTCADLNELLLGDNRQAARCVSARGANLSKARLAEAQMAGIDLRGARLEEARLEAADLAHSVLSGANFASAHLEQADLTGGVQAQGANFLVASLQGADLTGAQLQFADFSSASLQSAMLAHAHLQGAKLRDADLEGGDLNQTRLHGADMTGAKLRAADLRGAGVWMTLPPDASSLQLADLGDLIVKPLDELDVSGLARAIERAEEGRPREQAKDALAAVMDLPKARNWAGSNEQQAWTRLVAAAAGGQGDTFKQQLTDHLAKLMCKSRWSLGSVAAGVARRAQTQQFKGDMLALYDRLRAADCPASKAMASSRLMQSLTSAADLARSN